jgi:hypothetical protein
MKKIVLITLMFALTACAAQPTSAQPTSAQPTSAQPTLSGVPPVGFVEGKVSIGPLAPGPQRIDQTPQPISPEVYAAYVIRIYRADDTTKVIDVQINSDGTYRAGLQAGSYTIAAIRADGGATLSKGQPQSIEIQSGQTLHLDIDIDTGMR